MARNGKTNGTAPASTSEGITRISVAGFKSIRDEQSIEIRPLTILAGANSSGKSSIMQPLLLMKQTLEAPYDPGTLLLNGPNVQFSFENELFSWDMAIKGSRNHKGFFKAGITLNDTCVETTYKALPQLHIEASRLSRDDKVLDLEPDMSSQEILSALNSFGLFDGNRLQLYPIYELMIMQNRCFLETMLVETIDGEENTIAPVGLNPHSISLLRDQVQRFIHVLGIRGDVKKPYPVAAIDRNFPGVFDSYVGAAIFSWQEKRDERLALLIDDMIAVKLITSLEARRVNDVSIELFVNRLPNAPHDTEDKVNITQVGLGVPVTLSAVTALHAARPDQMVYIEQPELHLHPRAQVAMATILANAALRGVRVVVETHSSLLLQGVQTLVAEGKLDPKLVALHWFTRDDEGNTKVDSADLDEAGAFGSWPEDFGDVELRSQSRYLDAAEERLAEMSANGR